MGIKERRKREEVARLAAILSAAESVFAKKGYHETRMDDIAEAAELAKGTLYYYFKSKDKIYLHLLERESETVYTEIKRRLSEKASFLESLEGILNFYVEYFKENLGFLKIFLPCLCGYIHFEDVKDTRASRRSYERHAEYVREALEKKMKKERLRLEMDDLFEFLRTFQIGISMRLLEGKWSEAEDAARFFLVLMKRLMEKNQ
jgi:AcrR family transcriptional regulator